jgi:hypothetical protein
MPDKIEFSLYKHLSGKAQLKLFSAIFFTFAPLALMSITTFGTEMPRPLFAFWLLSSGVIAVGWAYSFIRNIKIMFVIIPLQILIIVAQIFLGIHYGLPRPEMSITGALMVTLIVVGYVFYVSFINGEGMRSYRLQTEINLAKDIHDHLVPEINYSNEKVDIYGYSVAAGEVGGDLLDLVKKDGAVYSFVADVSGHGVRAGVMMGMLKSAIRMQMHSSEIGTNPVDAINDVLYELKRPDMFATFAGLLIGKDSSFSYINAGHPPILHFSKSAKKIQQYESSYPPLAVLPGQNFGSINIKALSGDLLILVTDGFVEVFDKSDNEFGIERIEEILMTNYEKPLKEIYEILSNETTKFGRQSDDQTFLAIRVN